MHYAKKSSAALGAHAPHAPTDKDTNVPARNPERADLRYNVLGQTGAFVGCISAGLGWKDVTAKRGDIYYESRGVDPYYRQLYFEKYVKLDPCSVGQFLAEVGRPVITADVIPYEESVQTRIYKEWANPQGLIDCAMTVLDRSATAMSFLALFRHERDPAFRIGTLALAVAAACGLSLHAVGVTKRRFSRSIRKPGRASRRLHAGCRSGGIRTSPELIPEEGSPLVLTSPNPFSTLLQRFACARLSRPCLPESRPGVSATLTTTAFDRSSLRWLEIGT